MKRRILFCAMLLVASWQLQAAYMLIPMDES